MPVYWPEFWQAVEGLNATVTVAYLRVLSYYWHHNACRGLINDDVFLRSLCRVDREEWDSVKQFIFNNGENFFRQESGLWHQKRCREEYGRAVDLMNKRKNQTQAARESRIKNK